MNKTLGIVTYALNLFDLFCTLCFLHLGVGKEYNPFMQNVHFMVLYKTMIMGVLLWWLSTRHERIAQVGLWFCAVFYTAVSLYYIVGIILILGVK